VTTQDSGSRSINVSHNVRQYGPRTVISTYLWKRQRQETRESLVVLRHGKRAPAFAFRCADPVVWLSDAAS